MQGHIGGWGPVRQAIVTSLPCPFLPITDPSFSFPHLLKIYSIIWQSWAKGGSICLLPWAILGCTTSAVKRVAHLRGEIGVPARHSRWGVRNEELNRLKPKEALTLSSKGLVMFFYIKCRDNEKVNLSLHQYGNRGL